jgi:hypothetical protein
MSIKLATISLYVQLPLYHMWDRISDVRIKLPNVTSNGMYRQKSPLWHIITAYRKQRILYRSSYHHHHRRRHNCRRHHHHRCKKLGLLVARATKFPTLIRHIFSIFITIVSSNTEATDSSQFHGSVKHCGQEFGSSS